MKKSEKLSATVNVFYFIIVFFVFFFKFLFLFVFAKGNTSLMKWLGRRKQNKKVYELLI